MWRNLINMLKGHDRPQRKRRVAALVGVPAIALASMALGGSPSIATGNSPSTGDEVCYEQVPVYKYNRTVPEVLEQSHLEYRWTKPPKTHTEWVVGKVYNESVYNARGQKVHSAGDHHETLYGPYTLTSDPYTVPFNVGSGTHVVGDVFTYNEPNYTSSGQPNGVIDYTYVLVSGPTVVTDTPAGDTGWVTDSTPPSGSGWVPDPESPKKVVDVPYAASYVEYYVEGGTPSQNEADATPIEASSLDGWTQYWSGTVNGDEIPCAPTPSVSASGVCVDPEHGTISGTTSGFPDGPDLQIYAERGDNDYGSTTAARNSSFSFGVTRPGSNDSYTFRVAVYTASGEQAAEQLVTIDFNCSTPAVPEWEVDCDSVNNLGDVQFAVRFIQDGDLVGVPVGGSVPIPEYYDFIYIVDSNGEVVGQGSVPEDCTPDTTVPPTTVPPTTTPPTVPPTTTPPTVPPTTVIPPPVPPSLTGNTRTEPQCVADAPWITVYVEADPGTAGLNDNTVELIFTDGTHTHTVTVGDVSFVEADGLWKLSKPVLWPGATVDADGNAITWPGYITNSDGTYTPTDDPAYFGWTRSLTSVTIRLNPELEVAIAYPPPSSNCDNPPENPTPPPTVPPTVPPPTTPPVDVCKDDGSEVFEGVQTSVPVGFVRGSDGYCRPASTD